MFLGADLVGLRDESRPCTRQSRGGPPLPAQCSWPSRSHTGGNEPCIGDLSDRNRAKSSRAEALAIAARASSSEREQCHRWHGLRRSPERGSRAGRRRIHSNWNSCLSLLVTVADVECFHARSPTRRQDAISDTEVVVARIVALGAIATLWVTTDSWNDEETVALIAFVVEALISYVTPNHATEGGVPTKV